MSDSTIYELTVLHIKPKYMIEFLTELPQAQKLYAQHGAKYLGTWLSDAGALSQIYSLVEWGN